MIKFFGLNIFTNAELAEQIKAIGDLTKEVKDLQLDLEDEKVNNEVLLSQITQLTASPNPKEDYYNNKYPKSDINYLRHETDGDYQVDVRDFFQLKDSVIPIVQGKTDDEKALNSLKWIIANIKYTPDNAQNTYKWDEYWAYAYQTMHHKMGDCEDGAILLANIMQKSGIPYWKIRLNAGNVKGGGHAYVVYYCEETDKWVILDWCYWANTLAINKRKDYKEETNYLDVWFSWNEKYCFTKGLNIQANKLLNK